MFAFVNYLRAIATVLITNSHYGTVWPSSALAVGGLLGNVLFFAVSGFCLFKIKENFPKWYGKRILKILPVMIIFTLFTILIGVYKPTTGADWIRLLVFPTNYVFIVWIVILYIPFYLVAYFSGKKPKVLKISCLVVFAAWLIVYFVAIDKSAYTVDEVYKPFILFVYFLSMLVGAFFKQNYDKFVKGKKINILFLLISLVAYFGSKFAITKFQSLLVVQILNQFVLLVSLYFFLAVFIGFEERLKKFNKKFNGFISYVAKLTLYIYLVQFVVIAYLDHLVFPLNFLVITVGIFASASALYYLEYFIRKGISKLALKIKNKNTVNDTERENAESKD